MTRRLHLVLAVLCVFVFAFSMVVSLHSISAAQGSYPFPDGPGGPKNDDFDSTYGGCCQVIVHPPDGGPPRVVSGVWTGNGCSCDRSAFAGSPCAFSCP